jgi:dipeptidase
MREIWDWDDSVYLGTIPEANETYNVIGNINEHGLIIGETTFGGLHDLDGHGTGAIMDYGSLIWVTLQRAKTAREAIKMIDDLCTEYGYASDGESFSIADQNEIWLMELIGKGKEKGAVWVASRVPEGFVGSTANQARTRQFVQNDPDNVLFAKDVVTFAQAKGLYPKDKPASEFSFCDAYDPISATSARLAEARVWNLFRQIGGADAFDQYLDYAQGRNLTNRMPLFAKASHKLSVNDTMWNMRTHFEGTWFDNEGYNRKDVGAGPGNSPYRWRPLTWKVEDKTYVNERTIGVQQTAWNFVAQSRGWLPAPIGGLIWWAPDDSSTAVRIPVYAGSTSVPPSFGDRVGQDPAASTSDGVEADAYTMSMDSAFWIWNLVGTAFFPIYYNAHFNAKLTNLFFCPKSLPANIAYGERYRDVYPVIQQKIAFYEEAFFAKVAVADKAAASLYKTDQAAAIKYITDFTVSNGEQMTKDWRNFWMHLFSYTRDGFTTTPTTKTQCKIPKGPNAKPSSDPAKDYKDCTARKIPNTATTGYSDAWYARILAEPGAQAHYGVPTTASKEQEEWKLMRMEKRRS